MKKTVFGLVLCMTFLLVGCGSKDKDETNGSKNAESSVNSSISLTYNGQTFTVGDTYDKVKGGLGDEIKPSEVIPPCDGEGDDMTEYYFDGLTVGVDESGIVDHINLVSEGGDVVKEAETDKGLKLGDTADKAKELYGEPLNDSEYVVSFDDGDLNMTCGLGDDGTITYFYIINNK
ncbi:MAG: hypothetical protein J6P57_05395 [Lachnospiraceae bacterium]|nr:hypothetical protein [Lachnospiraceae bacterium]